MHSDVANKSTTSTNVVELSGLRNAWPSNMAQCTWSTSTITDSVFRFPLMNYYSTGSANFRTTSTTKAEEAHMQLSWKE